MADFNKTVDLDKGLNRILDKIDSKTEELHQRGQEAGEAIGRGVDDGISVTVEKIKASSVKTDKAFKNLSEKIRKQVQQLSTNIGGKDTKIKIDFSDVDINSEAIKKKIQGKVASIKGSDLIDFDTKNFDSQLTNFVTLFMKYQEKLKSLKQEYPSISVPKDAQNNLQQQLALATELDKMFRLLNGHGALFTGINLGSLQKDLSKLQQFSDVDTSKVAGDYNELSKVLKEIQGSLKVISDTFKNENNSMKAMAEGGVTSFESLSQAIIGVYNNLTQVQSLVDSISQKDFNITNITQTGGGNSSLQAMTQQMAVARETMEHLRQLYDQAGDTVQLLADKGQVGLVFEYQKQLQELDMTAIGKSVKGANTEMKLASVLAEMQDYIDKLIQINELRNKFDLGGWNDAFIPTKQSVVKPKIQQEVQTTPTTVVVPTQTTATNSTETQQVWQLKAAVDEVSNAIGRKNAGFIKEQEIVNTSVEAEKQKLKELVGVITNEIGLALDNIKAKFAQSFVVPELDKNNLQSSFDEIYNKFIELKDKIQTMEIDVGINTANITTAIQEALYAKEIEANYDKLTFDNVYDREVEYDGSNTFTNRITGEMFVDWDDVLNDFNQFYKNLYQSKDGLFIGTKEEILSDLIQRPVTTPEQTDWAQVIVEAINTQGNNIVEAIKIILPKNLSDGINSTDDIINESQLSEAFKTLTNALSNWSHQTGGTPGDFFWNMLERDSRIQSTITPDVSNALHTLGLTSNVGEPTFTMPDTGLRNLGVAIADRIVLTTQDSDVISHLDKLQEKLNEAYQLGASVPRILGIKETSLDSGDAVFQLQSRVSGENIHSNNANKEFLGASPEQIDRLIHTFETLNKVGLFPDFVGDNIMFDQQKGFSLVDLDTRPLGGVRDPDDMINAFLRKIYQESSGSSDEFNAFSQKVRGRFALPPEKRLVNADTIATEQVASQNKEVTKSTDIKLTPTMDDGAVAKVVSENVAKTPATVKITPVVNSASDSEQAVDGEAQSTIDAAKTFVDAANAKKQFVEANKQVAESAKESTKAVEEESKAAEQAKKTMTAVTDDTIQPSNWDKISQLQTDHGEDPFALSRSKTENVGDESVRTIVESWGPVKDEDGKLTGELELNTVKIINDFKKRTDAITKENEKIKTAQAYLQKFLTQFNNKTMGKGRLLAGYQDLVNLANSSDFKIDDIAKAEQMMSNLDAEYNKVVQSMRKGSSSMNPFVNAINSIEKMEDVLQGISLQFRTLNQQPEWLGNDIIDLYKQLDSLPTPEADIHAFAKGFGNLKVAINSVTETIRQQRAEQKLATSDFNALVKATKTRDTNTEKAAKEEDGSVWKTYYLDRAAEQQKMIDAIRIGLTLTEAQETQLNAMAEKHALILGDITRENDKIEEQKQKYEEIMRLLEKNHADQIELDNDTLLDANDRSVYQQILNEERAEIEALIANTDLNPKQKKSVDTSLGLIEDDRVAKVKNYIDLLKLQYDYEKKAAKEDNGSKMQSFYNDQVVKVKEKIKKIDINTIANQEEKNKLLVLEEAHQRAIAEIQEKKNASSSKSTMPFDMEDEKVKFGQSLKKDFTGLLTAVMGGTSIHTFVQYMRQGIQSVRELDLALTELKKVTDATEETYDKFLDTASKTSARIGKTITEMTSATAEFAKLGYDIELASSMAESALVYANVGDNVDVETGSQSIISTLKAFGIEANNTMSIVDKFNEVGNNFAITTKGIGDALQVSASAMAAAGNTLDETIALTTAANTIVQNPNTVGTALKTSFCLYVQKCA